MKDLPEVVEVLVEEVGAVLEGSDSEGEGTTAVSRLVILGRNFFRLRSECRGRRAMMVLIEQQTSSCCSSRRKNESFSCGTRSSRFGNHRGKRQKDTLKIRRKSQFRPDLSLGAFASAVLPSSVFVEGNWLNDNASSLSLKWRCSPSLYGRRNW